MSARDVLAVAREADRSGERVTAVYHSHVGAAAYLSPDDLSYAQHAAFPFPGADQIVLSVFERSVREIKIFVRRGGGFSEHFVRAEGFRPSVTDDRFLWAWERGRVSDGSSKTLALVGASRIHVGWSSDVGHELLPDWTIAQLAITGTAPIGTLRDLAADRDFRGVAIVDMTEGHFVKKAWRRQRAQITTYHERWLTPGS